MNDEITQAFAHPELRSKATQSEPLDRISLRDHIVSVEIGAFQAERDMTQRISFNIVVEVRQSSAELNDDVDLILSYDRVTEAIDAELAAERLNLLETLAERVADRILKEPQAVRVFVRIEKLDRGAGALGVEIVRSENEARGDVPEVDGQTEVRMVFLSNAALEAGNLEGWIDQMIASDVPHVISVAAPEGCGHEVADQIAQARIDLLTIEQNAWRLVAREARIKVVQTRTELDWALKNGQLSVIAPSKFVFDAVDGPRALAGDAPALALWLAGEVGAETILSIGATLPSSPEISVINRDVTDESF